MEEVESRFLHLLQPIRDLTKNWEVDVAAQLGEYLEELDQICISFDNGRTTMNFIEAALLIQGSACIYSRKVEYLYSLVYQALDLISNKKREKQPSSVGQDGKDTDATFGAEEPEQFLSLDDIRDSSPVNVDMRKDREPNAVNIVPLTPMSLVPPEEAEKRDTPLLRQQPLRYPEGIWSLSEAPAPGSPWNSPAGGVESGDPRGFFSPFDHFVPLPGAAGLDDDNSSGDDAPGVLEHHMEITSAANERVEAQRSVPRARGYMLRERAPVEDPKTHVKELLDPWQSLDPFGDSEDKPFKKGRPFVVPHGLDDVVGGKRKRRGPRKLQDFMKWFSAACECPLPRPMPPICADLEGLYWKQLKERLAAQRKLQSCTVSEGLAGTPAHPHRGAPGMGLGVLGGLSESPLPADDFVEHEDVQPEDSEELGDDGALGECWGGNGTRDTHELFMANSQKYAQETELSQHVRRWEERMGPLLQEQAGTGREERATFDIHGYGAALAGRCGKLGRWCSFASLVAGLPPFEVCRYMLASLQLVS
ncbi:CNDH2 protein, partial [Pterocles burchelli]|nr:CNDH2 protein [Pterocles burchelli]